MERFYMLILSSMLLLALAIAYLLGRLHQIIIEHERERKRLSNHAINGLEDLQALDTEALLRVQDALLITENRLQHRMNLVGQIRNGEYQKNQAAAPRGNGAKS